MSYIDIRPGTVAQVQRSLRGELIAVDSDVQNVANDLRALDSSLHLFYSELESLWVVMQEVDGEEHLVTTAQECDQRIVARVREITSPGYDLAAEIEQRDRESAAAVEYAAAQRDGEVGERLLHAIRHDKGEPAVSVIIPRGVDG